VEHGIEDAKLVVVDGDGHSRAVEESDCFGEVWLVVERVHPKGLEIRLGEPGGLQAHECDVVGE
jgi:hypothetical protein